MKRQKLNSDEVKNRQKLNSMNSMDSMVFCKDGLCRKISPEEYLEISFPNKEAQIVEESLAKSQGGKSKKAKRKKNKKSKSKKDTTEDMIIPEEMLPKAGEDTVLLNKAQTKKALPLGAVEIGKLEILVIVLHFLISRTYDFLQVLLLKLNLMMNMNTMT